MIGSVAWITEKLLQAYMHMNLEKMELNCICYGVQCGITDWRESYRINLPWLSFRADSRTDLLIFVWRVQFSE